MDDVSQAAPSPAPSPAKGKARKPTGKGVRKTKKAVPKKGNRGRGGRRNKVYANPRVQAAYERQQDLSSNYLELAKAMKPALEALADMNIKTLLENPVAYQEFEEYDEAERKLEEQHAAVIAAADRDLKMGLNNAQHTYELDCEATRLQFHNQFDYKTEEFYDGHLNRASILGELHREGAPVHLPDSRYRYVQASNAVAQDQGPYVMMRDGTEVPFPSLLQQAEDPKKAAAKPQSGRKAKPPAKRKAEDQPEGQPDTKKPLTGAAGPQSRNGVARDEPANSKVENGEDASTPLPRHIGGLLSAEQEADAEPESNTASPGAVLEDEQTPPSERRAELAAAVKRDLPDLPNGASEPDVYGVRTVFRRGPRANNRLVIPPMFKFDGYEIGFRDSTNDSTRKASRSTRGKFVNEPNSGSWHMDQSICNYNCLDYQDGDLDPELVRKHNLHPKYGLFMADSVNDSEPPSDHVDGTKPVVIVTPDGHTLHASRCVRAVVMDQALQQDAKKESMARMLRGYCQKEEIDEDALVSEEMRERERSALERIATINEEANEEARRQAEEEEKNESLRRERAGLLLHAAEYTEFEQPRHQPTNQRTSRPYDAVRDSFSNPEPPAQLPQELPQVVDTFGLSVLADVAEHVSLPPPAWHQEPPYVADSNKIDPRLLGPASQPPPPSNAFLQTALNPTPAYTPIAPAPPQEIELLPREPAPRNPFSGHPHTKGSPVLPPLRPSRRDKVPLVEAPPRPPSRSQEYDSPRGMIHTNSGTFYPPAPSRSYHQGYSLHEPTPIMPIPLQGPPPGMMLNQPPPHLVGYPVYSPPMPGQAQLAPAPAHIAPAPSAPTGPIPVLPAGPPAAPLPGQRVLSPTPPALTPRTRGSISSNGSASNAAKFRKIAAAPAAPNRPWATAGGTELRLAHYDHKEAIKDYRANEPPPRSGPTTIRGWNVNNVAKGRGRGGVKKEDSSEERELPRDSPNGISTYLNKWNPAE